MSPESIKEIEVFISTIGFPILMCWLMWKKITESDQKQSELLAELTKAINNLSIYIKEGKKNE